MSIFFTRLRIYSYMAISILYPHRKFWRSLYGTNFLEISNGRKTVRMAPILTIFGPNESQRCQLNFEQKIGPSKKFPWGRKIRKTFAKSSKNFGPYTVFGTKQNRNVHIVTCMCGWANALANAHMFRNLNSNLNFATCSGHSKHILN